jgi:hypothetical protein
VTRFQQTLRRVGVVAATLLIGAGGAVAVSAPASATPETSPFSLTITGEAGCAEGARQITWTVTNNHPELKARITWVGDGTNSHTPENPKVVGDIAKGNDLAAGATATGVEAIADEDTRTEPKLVVAAAWTANDGFETFATVDLTGLTCAPTCVTAENAQYTHTFDAQNGDATVRLKGDLPLCEGEEQDFSLVAYYATDSAFSYPQYLHDAHSDTLWELNTQVELHVDVPKCFRQIDLVFGGEDGIINPIEEGGELYGDRKLGSAGAPGNRSEGPQGWFNGGRKSCVQPAADFVSNCDGTVTVHLTNNSKAPFDAKFVVTGVDGETVVAAGASTTVTVPAEHAGDITVTEATKKKTVDTYQWQRPEDCPPPTADFASTCDNLLLKLANPEGNTTVVANVTAGGETEKIEVAAGAEDVYEIPTDAGEVSVTFEGFKETFTGTYAEPADCAAGGGGGGGLPVTGPQAGAMAGGAALLLGAGAVLFMMARRRRIKFAA